MLKNQKGFTLVELLVVITIISILSTLAVISFNPFKQFANANNAQRKNDISTLINAVTQYASDNRGVLPASITTTEQPIKKTGGADLCADLVPKYIAALPKDPKSGTYTDCTAYDLGYTITKSSQYNRITITAPYAELSETISITK